MRKARSFLVILGLLMGFILQAQTTFPVNGVADERTGHYAFTNATIVKDATTTLTNAIMVIKEGKIVAVGTDLKVPAAAVTIDCRGKYIYPSFIDIFPNYGMPLKKKKKLAQVFLHSNNTIQQLK